MFKRVNYFVDLVLMFMVLGLLRTILFTLRVVNGISKVVMFLIRALAVVVVLILSFPLSLVARLLGFLAFVVAEGIVRGYTVAKDEISIGGRVARRMKLEPNSKNTNET